MGKRRSKADEVYDLLRNRIVRTELGPDQHFVGGEIVAETGYGATPVREALDRLDRDGFVVTIPRRGYRVAPVTTKTYDDFMEVWVAILPQVVRSALKRMSPEQALRLDQSFEAKPALGHDADDPAGPLASRQERYRLLAEATNNATLARVFERLANESERYFWVAYSSDPKIVGRLDLDPVERHLWKERDEERMVQLLMERIDESRAFARKIFEEREARDPGTAT